MSNLHTTQALTTSHADLITCLSFSFSTPSLLASTSIDGWIRIHARIAAAPNYQAIEKNDVPTRSATEDGHSGNDEDEADFEQQDEWIEVGGCKVNEGPVWKAIWGPREYGTNVLVTIAGSLAHVWGE